MVWVTYDPGLPYPQDADFGSGIERKGSHTPPDGFVSFLVPNSNLSEGIDERFYQVTSADNLSTRSPTEIQAIKDADAAKQQAKEAEMNNAVTQTSNPMAGGLTEVVERIKLMEQRLGWHSDVPE
jgi:hypothetical protein